MKKRSRFLRRFLIVLAFVAAGSVLSLVYLWGHADRILTRIADSKLKEFVSRSDSFDLRYSSLDLNLANGTIRLNGVVFSKDSLLHPELTGGRSGIAGDPVPYTVRGDDAITGMLLFCFVTTLVVFSRSRHFLVDQLKNILTGLADELVRIEFNKTNASFVFGDYVLICRLLEGRYPNYEAVIPKNNPNQLTIDRQTFLSAIRRVAVFSSKATHQVRFRITGQEIMLTAEDIDFYNEAKERLACSYMGDDMEIGFNSRFFQEMLGNFDSNEVKLEMSAPNRAGILTPVDNENEAEDLLMLLMPVMLNA